MNKDNLRKVKVRDMDRDTYIGYSLNQFLNNENNETCLVVEDLQGNVEAVQIERVKFISDDEFNEKRKELAPKELVKLNGRVLGGELNG